jgi:hypothetical protein
MTSPLMMALMMLIMIVVLLPVSAQRASLGSRNLAMATRPRTDSVCESMRWQHCPRANIFSQIQFLSCAVRDPRICRASLRCVMAARALPSSAQAWVRDLPSCIRLAIGHYQ